MADFVDEAIAQLTAAGLTTAAELRGCTQDDITEIEAKYRIMLPAAYRRFLTAMGRSAGKFLQGRITCSLMYSRCESKRNVSCANAKPR
jgi:hypothetical protein